MTLLLQVSDTHFGTERPPVVKALVQLALARKPQVLLLSGDITQRATRSQFAAAQAFVQRLRVPHCVAVPGNHDIPLWQLPLRLLRPYARYSAAFGPDLEPSLETDDLLLLALNTTRWWRHEDGQLSAAQVERVAQRLALARPGQRRVVMVHQSPLRVMHYKQDGVVSTTPLLTASADKVSGPAPLTVAFTPVAVDLFAPSYQWDFGDGAIARTATSLHTFAAGTYAVMVHAVFANGAVLSADPLSITAAYVPPPPPVPTSLVLGSSTVVGGKATTGTVTVSGSAGALVV